jgi:hypothetical protein
VTATAAVVLNEIYRRCLRRHLMVQKRLKAISKARRGRG